MAVIVLTATSLRAQKAAKPIMFSLGVDAGLPIGNAGDVYSFIIGGSLQGEYKAATELGITLNAGYKSWSVKKDLRYLTDKKSNGFIPVLAGIKYYFTPMVYGAGQLGVSFSTESNSGSLFTYTPGVGFQISPHFDVLVKYTGMSARGGGSLGEVGVRVAYGF